MEAVAVLGHSDGGGRLCCVGEAAGHGLACALARRQLLRGQLRARIVTVDAPGGRWQQVALGMHARSMTPSQAGGLGGSHAPAVPTRPRPPRREPSD